jgi:hypothetical protein
VEHMEQPLYCERCGLFMLRGSTAAWQNCLTCSIAPWYSRRSHYEGEHKTRYPDRDRLRRRIRWVRFVAAVRGVEPWRL